MNALLITPAGEPDSVVPYDEAIAYICADRSWTLVIVPDGNDDDNQLDLSDYANACR